MASIIKKRTALVSHNRRNLFVGEYTRKAREWHSSNVTVAALRAHEIATAMEQISDGFEPLESLTDLQTNGPSGNGIYCLTQAMGWP